MLDYAKEKYGMTKMDTNTGKHKQVVIGIDQSYQNTGVTIVVNGKIKKIASIELAKQCKTNSERRKLLNNRLSGVFNRASSKYNSVVCIVERARLHGGPTSFINIDAIKAIGALTATIVDAASEYDIPVYSVDTRCWKSQVIGTSKGERNIFNVPEEKWPTIQWICSQGFEDSILIDITGSKQTKGTFERNGHKYIYNNDAADSAGIAMFWYKGDHSKLKEER